MKKILLFFLVLFCYKSIGQSVNYIDIKFGILAGVGTAYKDLEYYSLNTGNYQVLNFSGGGGFGLEGGLTINPWKKLKLEFGGNIEFLISAANETDVNGNSMDTSPTVTFNRKSAVTTIKYGFPVWKRFAWVLNAGIGGGYYIPGKLKMDNGTDSNKYYFNPSPGFHVMFDLEIPYQSIIINPSLKYRNLSFDAGRFADGKSNDVPENLRRLDASGIELGLAVLISINNSNEL